jgi:predicted DNA-binding transcriptional regulator AlpA
MTIESTATEFVSIPELAKRVGTSEEHLYRLARRSELPGVIRLGHRYVVNYGVFVEASRVPITSAAALSASSRA